MTERDKEHALAYIPVILGQLDADGREMFAHVLQAMLEAGYNDCLEDRKDADHE